VVDGFIMLLAALKSTTIWQTNNDNNAT